MSSRRLRLECLETRNVLSAIGLPFSPPIAAPSLPTEPAEVYLADVYHVAKVEMQGAVQNTAATPHASPVLASDQHADSSSPVPIQTSSATSYVADLNPTKLQINGAATAEMIGVGSVPLILEIARNHLLLSPEMADDRSVSTTLTIYELLPQGLASEVAPDASPPVDPAVSPPDTNGTQPVVATLPPSLGSTGFAPAGFRVFIQAVPSSVANDDSPNVEASSSPVKGNLPDTVAASAGNQASVAVETSLSVSNGAVNPPATNVAFSNAATSNSLEGGFISLDDAPATAPQLVNTPSYNSGFQGVGGAELRGNWLTSALPSTRTPADSARDNSRTAPSSEDPSAEVSLRPAATILRSVAESNEGGSIELTIAAPADAVAGDDSLPTGEATVGAAQQLSEIRPESGVGLFCDIEVSVAPTLPVGSSPSSAVFYQNTASVVVGAGIHGWKANAAMEPVRPSSELPQPSTTGLTDHLPLLLGAAVLVSRGGLSLEEKVPERERRLRCIEDVRQSPISRRQL